MMHGLDARSCRVSHRLRGRIGATGTTRAETQRMIRVAPNGQVLTIAQAATVVPRIPAGKSENRGSKPHLKFRLCLDFRLDRSRFPGWLLFPLGIHYR